MATTPSPEPESLGRDRPAPPTEADVWETVRPVHPTSRFQAIPLAAVPPLARNLTITPRPDRVAKETRE